MILKDITIERLGEVVECIKKATKDKKSICVLLIGNLASGKTTLVNEFVKSLGVKEKVTSPTFSVQSIYDKDIYHYDIYNKSYEEFLSLGLFDELEKEGIHFIEWADEKLEDALKKFGFDYMKINIKIKGDRREYECIS